MPLSRYIGRMWTPARPGLGLGRPLIGGSLAQIWWVVLLRGLAAIALGAAVLVWPRHAALAIVIAFGVYALLDGALGLALSAWPGALRAPRLAALAAFTNMLAGTAALSHPRAVVGVLIVVLGVWLAFRGAALFVEAVTDARASRDVDAPVTRPWRYGTWGALLDGPMTSMLGIGLLLWPSLGVLTAIWALGVWAILHGILMDVFALEQRRSTELCGPP